MARLFEYQSKKLLDTFKIPIPKGRFVNKIEEVDGILNDLNLPVVIKAQAWVTGRAGVGGIKFANTKDEAIQHVKGMLGMSIKDFTVNTLLIEEKISIQSEYFAGIILDDKTHQPVLIFSSIGGSGIEEIAKQHPDKVATIHIDLNRGLPIYDARNLVRKTGVHGNAMVKVSEVLVKLYNTVRHFEARSGEINPLVLTTNGDVYAADCHLTIDDYAVFRHPELDVKVAREYDRPPTKLEEIAYNIEKNDYRGTFYFIQMAQGFKKGEGYLGFHGAGGGGSMMSMDAVLNKGFKIANFCDTSGNPPASKVYRAARIILSQENIDGYFSSGSGVASQEQFHSARGLLKAFRDVKIDVPAVLRLGGNMEEKAIEILTKYSADLDIPIECYGKDTPASFCAERLKEISSTFKPKSTRKNIIDKPKTSNNNYSFKTVTKGTVSFDYELCKKCSNKVCVKDCVPQILKLENDLPVLAITPEEAAKGKCTECLACEIECFQHGNKGGHVELPMEELESFLSK